MTKLNEDVLKLNKNWQIIGTMKVRQALSDMAAGAVTGLYINGDEFTPLRWREWINIPIERDDENYIQASKTKVKIPRVVICVKFNKLIVKPPKLTMKALRARDNDTCILSGKKLKPSQMSKEHLIPVSKGGKDEWENIGLCDRDLNSERGNMPYEKFGKKPLWKPVAPRGRKPSESIVNSQNYPEWDMFLEKDKKN